MPRAVALHIPQPCHESWAAMTPTAAGRHCAACQKTVVDFTQKTDAEILAYLARAAGGRTCGRFAAGQLSRPLQRAVPVAPTGRWRAWLAAAVAVWGVRESIGHEARAQAPTEWRARYWGGPAPAAPLPDAPLPSVPLVVAPLAEAPVTAATVVASDTSKGRFVIRGVVRDSSEHLGLPGVTVLLKNTQIGVSTDADGAFALTVPSGYVTDGAAEVQLSSVGYVTQLHRLSVQQPSSANRFFLEADVKGMLTGEVMVCYSSARILPPAPWHPRSFYYWGKYWLTRPFRRW